MFQLNRFTLVALLFNLLIVTSLSSPIQVTMGTPSQDIQSTVTQKPLNPQIPLRILPLGNSITWGAGSKSGNGYRQPLLDLLSNNVTYVGSVHSGNMTNNENEGHPGATIDDIAQFATQSLKLRPNIILLMAGTNDMIANEGEGAEEAPLRLGKLIDRCAAACPDSVVMVAQLTPFLHQPSQKRANVFNAAIPGLVEKRVKKGLKVLVVDMMKYVELGWLADGLHPSNVGYEGMAKGWYTGLKEASGRGWIEKPKKIGDDEMEEL